MYCNKCGDPIEPNEKFCNKCGNKLDYTPQKNNKKKMIIIGGSIGLVLVLIVFCVTYFFINRSKYFYNIETNNGNEVTKEKNEIERNQYTTVIITDNKYDGVKISGINDANELIVKDSINQKNNCPKEIKVIEDEIINKYGITAVNLCELDPLFAKELIKVLDKIYKEYPSIRDHLTNMSLINGSIRDNYIAAFMPIFDFAYSDTNSTYPWIIKTQVFLNTSYFLNQDRLKASVEEGSSSGHFPKNATMYSPVAHEFGHFLSFLAMMKNYDVDSILLIDNNNVDKLYILMDDFRKGDYSLSMIKEAYENCKNDNKTNIEFDEWRGTISKYALAKDNNGNYIYDETIAESFHDVYLNGNKATDASKYIVSVLKNKLGSEVIK